MTTIKLRRGTASEWATTNPIPAQGEPCYETDTGKLKIGDGTTNYLSLPYITDGSTYTLQTASTTTLGGVKPDGTTITVDGNGVISSTGVNAVTLTQAEYDALTTKDSNTLYVVIG